MLWLRAACPSIEVPLTYLFICPQIFEEMCDEELWDRVTAEGWLLPLASHFLRDPTQGFDVHVAWSLVVTKILPVISYEKIRRVDTKA